MNAVVALVAILITGGMATLAVLGRPVPGDHSAMVAAGVDSRDAVASESPSVTTAPIPPAPTTTARQATRPPTTLANGSVSLTASPPSAPDPAMTPVPTTAPPTTAAPTATVAPPPASSVVQTGPSSWSLVAEGVTVNASITPAAPRVGDEVTVSYTMAGDGEYCCLAFVYVDGNLVGQNELPSGPCPLPGEASGTATAVVGKAGLIRLQIQGTRFTELCSGSPVFATANLRTTFLVRP
ncbi:MAG TPA: hypothetical protein VF244_01280 [Acidimicrobiales bacterium]